MRVRRTPVICAGALSLLLLSTSAVFAQSESCTGSIEFSDPTGEATQAWQASDPRLSGIATPTGGWSLYAPASEIAGELDAAAQAASFILSNEGGSWRCITSAPGGPEPDIDTHSLVFQGLDGYEGLTAYVQLDTSADAIGFSGFISDEGPPADPTLAG
jgi:hypothetical protein